MRRRWIVPFALLVLASPVAAADKGAPGHQHGAAQLQVSVDGQVLQLTFEGPADNILGFERAPANDAQRATVARASERLKQPSRLFTVPAAAECQVKAADVDMKLPPPGSREAHSEIEAEWRWECTNPAALAHIDIGLFKAFPRLKQLRAMVVTGRGQTTKVLRPDAARLALTP